MVSAAAAAAAAATKPFLALALALVLVLVLGVVADVSWAQSSREEDKVEEEEMHSGFSAIIPDFSGEPPIDPEEIDEDASLPLLDEETLKSAGRPDIPEEVRQEVPSDILEKLSNEELLFLISRVG